MKNETQEDAFVLVDTSSDYCAGDHHNQGQNERQKVVLTAKYGTDSSIALAARISYGAKHVEAERVEPIIKALIMNKEGTPFEFASMWFYIRCSRLCHSQFLQYRHASRITRSTRRVDPIESESADLDKLPAGYERTHIDYALRDYAFQTDELKIPREIARRILPMSILTEFYWLVNLRELMHFLDERLSSRAEQEIRDIAKRMELEFAGAFPITYKAWRGQDHLAGRKYSSNDYVSFLKRYMELRNLGEQE